MRILLIFLIYSCVPQGSNVDTGNYSSGGLAPNGHIKSISTSGDKLIINGSNFQGITAVTITNESNTFQKPFQVLSATASQIVALSVNRVSLPLDTILNLILSNSLGQSLYNVTFVLQKDSVNNAALRDNAVTAAKIGLGEVTRLKLNKEPTDNPNSGDILAWQWDDFPFTGHFVFTPGNTGAGGGVVSISKGPGIRGEGQVITDVGTIGVNVDTKGDAVETKIPYFNTQNQVVIENPAKLVFKDYYANYSLFNDNGVFTIREESAPSSPTGYLQIDKQGNVTIPGDLYVSGQLVCLSDGTNCSGSVLNVVGPGSSASGTVPFFSDSSGRTLSDSGISARDIVTNLQAANADNIAVFDGPSGRVIKDGGKSVLDLVTNALPAVSGNVASFYGTSGKIIVDSGVAVDSLVTGPPSSQVNYPALFADGSGKTLAMGSFSLPNSSGLLNQVLTADGLGAANWVTSQGNILGPALVTAAGNIAVYSDLSGRNLSDSNVSISNVVVGPPNALVGSPAVFNGPSGKILGSLPYTFPTVNGNSGQVLKTNGAAGVLAWADDNNSGGNVVGAASNTTATFPLWSGTTGKILQNQAVLFLDLVNSRIGVGTSTPTVKLEVIGPAGNTNGARLGNAYVGETGLSSTAAFFVNQQIRTANNSFALRQDLDGTTYVNAASGKNISFRINNTEGMVFDSNRRLGIGVSPTNYPLEVVSATSSQSGARLGNAYIGNTALNTTSAFFVHNALQATNNAYALRQENTGSTYLNAANGQSIFFRIADADALTIASSKNVGIGTTNPTSLLSLAGSNCLELGSGVAGKEINAGKICYQPAFKPDSLALVGAGTNAVNRKIHLYDNVTIGGTLTVNGVTPGNVSGANLTTVGNPPIWGNATGTSLLDQIVLRIDTGNTRVGIGTTTPSERLDVQGGNIKTSGNISAGGNVSVTGSFTVTGTSTFNGDITDTNGQVKIGSLGGNYRLWVQGGGEGSLEPAAVFDTSNCGGACGQPDPTQPLVIINSKPTGSYAGVGFSDNLADIRSPSAWAGVHYTDKAQNFGDYEIWTRAADGYLNRSTVHALGTATNGLYLTSLQNLNSGEAIEMNKGVLMASPEGMTRSYKIIFPASLPSSVHETLAVKSYSSGQIVLDWQSPLTEDLRAENKNLEAEVSQLKDRVQNLERILLENENTLLIYSK